MHVIDECPLCHNDFMYHVNDTNLERSVDVLDAYGNNKGTDDFYICQDCDELEKLKNN